MEPRQMSAVILAGGKSSRMGRDKLFLPLGGKPVIEHLLDVVLALFAHCIVVTGDPEAYRGFAVEVVPDQIVGSQKNALTGIHAGLTKAPTPYAFVVAGDMPFLVPGVARYLCSQADGFDVTVPLEGDYYQPLCAVYHKNCLPFMERLLLLQRFKVTSFFADVRMRAIISAELRPFDPEAISFLNVNTPEDYRLAQERLRVQKQEREN